MAELIYAALASLDGYVADQGGKFDWAEPDEGVHGFVNDLSRRVGTFLLGRRMYEVLSAWETIDLTGEPSAIRDFAEIWRAADKIVYSRTLETASTAHAFRAGLVDECHLFLSPILVGGGTRSLPDGVRLELDLVDERSFGNGTVYLRYRRR